MMNLQQLLQNPMLRTAFNSKNPRQFAMNMISQNPQFKNNEIINNALSMMDNGNYKGVEQLGRNLIQSQGGNPDEILNMVKNMPMFK